MTAPPTGSGATGRDALATMLLLTPSDRPAVVWQGHQLTYAELDAAVSALARQLEGLGAARTSVLLLGPLTPAYVVGLLACLRSGAVVVPVDAGLTSAQYAGVAELAHPSVVVTSDVSTVAQYRGAAGVGELFLDAATGRVVLDTTDRGRAGDDEPRWRHASADAGYLIPSSGSTGRPKAVVGSRAGLHAFLTWFGGEFGLHDGDVCAAMTRANFDPSLRELLGVLLAGGRLVLPPVDAQLDLHALGRHLAESAATIAFLVPSVARRLADLLSADDRRLDALRLAFFAGEVLPFRVVEQWSAVAPAAEVVNLYGMTEGTLAQLFRRDVRAPGRSDGARSVPVGRPRPGVTVEIDEPDADGRGEVLVTSALPALGILQAGAAAPDRTLAVDPMPSPLRTGDVGYLDGSGDLAVIGRVGNAFKVSGRRVSFDRLVEEVEALPGVRQCVVVDRDGPHAFVAVGELPADALGDRVRRAAARLELPRPTVHVRAELPLLRSGKVDRVGLAASLPADGAGGSRRAATDDSVEQVLLGLLDLGEAVTADTSLVDAGLTSLDVMDLVVTVERRYGVRLSVQECFGHRDVATLARAIEAVTGEQTRPAAEPAAEQAAGTAPPPAQPPPVDAVPLSTRQVAYMATCMTDGNANWCNISREVVADRVLSREAVALAVRALLERHDVLRLALTGDWSHQRHTSAADLEPPVAVAPGSDADRQDDPRHRERVQQARVRAVEQLLDPTAAPPLRVVVVPGRQVTSVLVVAHHLFVDGLSLDVVADELRALLHVERLRPLPAGAGFRGYCAATRRPAEADPLDVGYWRQLLAGAQQVELPELSHPGAQQGELLSRPLGVAATRAAHDAAASCGVSAFAVLLAAYSQAVDETFSTGPVPIVIPVQLRNGLEAGTAGMFMSQLVVRAPAGATVVEQAAAVARQLHEGTARSGWEFDQRVDDLGLATTTSFPLSTVLFNQHPKARGLRARDLGSWQPRALGRTLRYQLQGELQTSGPEMVLTYYYRRGIANDAAALVDALHARVVAALSCPDRSVQHA